MDIEEFDRLYPSPAHAAAAELLGRGGQGSRRMNPKRLYKDRSGVVFATAGLAGSLLGGIAYLSTSNDAVAPTYVAKSSPSVPLAQAIRPLSRPARSTSIEPELAAAPLTVTASGRAEPVREIAKRKRSGKGSSAWILDPLSGAALATALIADKQRTIDLNAEQLKLMANDRNATAVSAPSIDGGGSDKH